MGVTATILESASELGEADFTRWTHGRTGAGVLAGGARGPPA